MCYIWSPAPHLGKQLNQLRNLGSRRETTPQACGRKFVRIVEATVREISARKRAAESLLQAADAQHLAPLAPAPARVVEFKNALEAANGVKGTAIAINAPTSPNGRPNLVAHHIVFAVDERIDATTGAFWQAIHFYVSRPRCFWW